MTKKLLYILFLLLMLPFMDSINNSIVAQSDAIDANIGTAFETAGEKEYRTVQYALFKTEGRARSVMAQLEKALAEQRGDNGSIDLDAWSKAVSKNNVRFRTSKGNGAFKVHALPGMALLVTSYLPEEEMTIEGAQMAVIPLRAGQTDYNHTFSVKMGEGAHTISNVDVFGTNRDTISITAAPAIDDGRNLYFNIHVELPVGYGNEKARLVVQPMAVDCQTEDTVDYISGLVMEGEKYHRLQNRRMLFDYMKHDKVAHAYVDKPLYSDEKVYIDTTLVYAKPNRKRNYKIPYTVQIADLNHIYFTRTASTGSCNSKNIFKFLDLGVAAADMDIEEFQIDAESVYDTKNQDLRLKFEIGRSELVTDSANQAQLNALIRELRSYGEQLMEVNVEATASPDGGLEHNRLLANERSKVAAAKVRSYLGSLDVTFNTLQPKVYTWDDVAKELEYEGRDSIAAEIRKLMGPDGYGGDAMIAQIAGYEEHVLPVLERLRIMRVTYRYEREHVMSIGEVTAEYYRRRSDLIKGRGRDFSDGDYYNLFRSIRDPKEQDTLTMLAYRHITKHAGYEQIKFSMYVANRMAMLNQRKGKPDASILAPFINPRLRAVTTEEYSEKAQKNRREVLINQIITYFQQEERDSALSFCDYWFAKDNDPKVERLKKYITFKEGFIKYATHQLQAEEEKKVLEAMDYVISCAPDNKAVIYVEGRHILNVPETTCMALVSAMDDMNPKKWYLRAILEADKEERKLAENKPKGYVPTYLAFFNRCFELEPMFKWYYFYDGQISDELREHFQYKKQDKQKYREIFRKKAVASTSTANNDDGEIEISGE